MNSKFIAELKWRGMIKDHTEHTTTHLSDEKMIAGYIGFDPTAPSLHIGNLCAIMLLKQLQLAGHKPIVLLGGFTGGIGDPAGKSEERKLLEHDVVETNLKALAMQFNKFLDFDCGINSAEIVNNRDWLNNLSLADFLREVGRYIPVNAMLARDSVKSRLEKGLSFTEFTYQLFQAFDFYWLFKNKNCRLQMGGSDQWGNIVAGFELIRKKLGDDAFALTTGLLTKPDGGKFGKSENGNIWLNPKMTSPYSFYQFWLNVDDAQIVNLFKIFTLRTEKDITNLSEKYLDDPNALKRILAGDLTRFVHSEEILNQVKLASSLLYSESSIDDLESISEDLLEEVLNEVPSMQFTISQYDSALIDTIIAQTLNSSKGEIKRLISGNGISINRQKLDSGNVPVKDFKLTKGKYLFIQKGKKYSVAKFVE